MSLYALDETHGVLLPSGLSGTTAACPCHPCFTDLKQALRAPQQGEVLLICLTLFGGQLQNLGLSPEFSLESQVCDVVHPPGSHTTSLRLEGVTRGPWLGEVYLP